MCSSTFCEASEKVLLYVNGSKLSAISGYKILSRNLKKNLKFLYKIKNKIKKKMTEITNGKFNKNNSKKYKAIFFKLKGIKKKFSIFSK